MWRHMKYKINEIFSSIQGEGRRAGMPAVFVRFSGCNLSCPFCDTDHQKYDEHSGEAILQHVALFRPRNVIFTGGEPALQLDNELLRLFAGYNRGIETNGTIDLKPIKDNLEWVTVSPKLTKDGHLNIEQINQRCGDEIKILKSDLAPLPRPEGNFKYYYVQFEYQLFTDRQDECLKLIQENPQWNLSVQMHKMLGIR